ncbi:hypothetical protein CJ030_MR2G005197 [Morella rubra]|uniref:Uncharacterized protein n=1 Tax=Morella rubra TaxID=262757 RepID=A0A6A1WAZ3_9ROSI|nr:hypothetical protein CJ030_MR2G005197 [Morella rubra]
MHYEVRIAFWKILCPGARIAVKVNFTYLKVEENALKNAPPEETEASGEVNMEASISTDDVIRAGGELGMISVAFFLLLVILLTLRPRCQRV